MTIINNDNNRQGEVSKNMDNPFTIKLNLIKSTVIGKNINFIRKIIRYKTDSTKYKIIYLYTGFDCRTCIEKGFSILKDIKQTNRINCYVIASNTNFYIDQIRYDYKDLIYEDKEDVIRKELRFLYTPSLLLVNKDNIVEDILFIFTSQDSIDFHRFFSKTLAHDKMHLNGR